MQAARARQLFLGRLQRDRLGQARLSRVRSAAAHFVEEILEARLFRRAGREGEAARAGVVPLVLREPQERRAGGAAAAVRLHRGISARLADPIRQARIRVQFAQALQRSGAAADRQIRAVMGRRAFRRAVRALSAATPDAAFEIFVPHPGRRQGLVPPQHRGPSRQGRRLLLLDHAHECRRRQGARHRQARSGQGVQRSRRGDLRGAADAAAAARRRAWLRVLGDLRSDGRAGQVGRSRRLPQSADARAHADQIHAFARRLELAGSDRTVGRPHRAHVGCLRGDGARTRKSSARSRKRNWCRQNEKMEHDHRRGRVHQLQSVHARRHGRICRQRLARLFGADAEARPQVDQHPAEGTRADYR